MSMQFVGSCILGFVAAFLVYFVGMVGYTIYRKKHPKPENNTDETENEIEDAPTEEEFKDEV